MPGRRGKRCGVALSFRTRTIRRFPSSSRSASTRPPSISEASSRAVRSRGVEAAALEDCHPADAQEREQQLDDGGGRGDGPGRSARELLAQLLRVCGGLGSLGDDPAVQPKRLEGFGQKPRLFCRRLDQGEAGAGRQRDGDCRQARPGPDVDERLANVWRHRQAVEEMRGQFFGRFRSGQVEAPVRREDELAEARERFDEAVRRPRSFEQRLKRGQLCGS